MNSKSQTKLSSFLTTLLNLFGLWPNTSLKRPYKIYSYVLHFITSFLFCFFMLVKLVTSINNVEAIIELLYPTLMVLAYMFKLLNYYKYGDNIVNSFNKLLNLQLRAQSDDKMYNSQLKDLTRLTAFLYCVSNFAWFVACTNTFLGSKVQLPVPSEYPFDWRSDKLYFWIAFLHQSLAGIILVNSNIGMDCFATAGKLLSLNLALFTEIEEILQDEGTEGCNYGYFSD